MTTCWSLKEGVIMDDGHRRTDQGYDRGHGATPPLAAVWLGGLGALPFIALSGAGALLRPSLGDGPQIALLAYGAVILSFLGGVHWGAAIVSRDEQTGRALPLRLIISVMPSLAGSVALLFPRAAGLVVLAVSFMAMLWVDLRATRLGVTPRWYPKIRIPLTLLVCASLLFGAVT
jgi:Protein of unknown function (DUF3429)